MRKRQGNTRGNGSIIALAVVTALALSACAQSLPPVPTQTSPQASGAAAQPSVNCDPYLPPGFKIPANALATQFSYRLPVDGTLHDLAVYRSSGNAELDQAAIACASATRFQVAKQEGNPIEINSIYAVSWNFTQHVLMSPKPTSEAPNICLGPYPAAALRRGVQGEALVSYRIATDGSVKNLTLERSAGDSLLDQASLDCVSAFRFFPFIHNRIPVEIDERAHIGWRATLVRP